MVPRISRGARAFGALIVVLCVGGGALHADLSSEFAGFEAVWEIGVSGLESSYHSPTKIGTTLPNYLPVLGPGRVTYPVGQVPSPGGSLGQIFDEGVLGVNVQGGSLVLRVAGGLDPLTGYWHSGWNTWYGQGDVFVTVEDSVGIRHYALLNAWARDSCGAPLTLDGSAFDQAQAFHVTGGAGGTSLEGHLVSLTQDNHVALTAGAGSYDPSYVPAPWGLDYRALAQGGTVLGDAGLTHDSTWDIGLGDVNQEWYLQTWTVPIDWLSSDSVFTIALHKTTTCGNDQIGDLYVVPAPSAVVLGALGLGLVGWARKRRV